MEDRLEALETKLEAAVVLIEYLVKREQNREAVEQFELACMKNEVELLKQTWEHRKQRHGW